MIESGRLEMVSARIDEFNVLEHPRTNKEARSFLNPASIYRRFLRQFAKVVGPLHELTDETPATLSPLTKEQISAFERLKNELPNPTTFALLTTDGHFVLDTDA